MNQTGLTSGYATWFRIAHYDVITRKL